MRVQSNGKVRRTSSEWESIFAEFEASSLSAAAFCRRKQIAKSTFTKRRQATDRKRAPIGGRGNTPRFVELTEVPLTPPSKSSPDTSTPHTFELELPGGAVLRWTA